MEVNIPVIVEARHQTEEHWAGYPSLCFPQDEKGRACALIAAAKGVRVHKGKQTCLKLSMEWLETKNADGSFQKSLEVRIRDYYDEYAIHKIRASMNRLFTGMTDSETHALCRAAFQDFPQERQRVYNASVEPATAEDALPLRSTVGARVGVINSLSNGQVEQEVGREVLPGLFVKARARQSLFEYIFRCGDRTRLRGESVIAQYRVIGPLTVSAGLASRRIRKLLRDGESSSSDDADCNVYGSVRVNRIEVPIALGLTFQGRVLNFSIDIAEASLPLSVYSSKSKFHGITQGNHYFTEEEVKTEERRQQRITDWRSGIVSLTANF